MSPMVTGSKDFGPRKKPRPPKGRWILRFEWGVPISGGSQGEGVSEGLKSVWDGMSGADVTAEGAEKAEAIPVTLSSVTGAKQ